MNKKTNLTFLLDVDGVLTSGTFLYSIEGKMLKEFGPHDSFMLKIMSPFVEIQFISADKRGFEISQKRVTDMGYEINLVPESERYEYVKSNFDFKKLIYMADGDADVKILKEAYLSVAPFNARSEAKKSADYITKALGGEGSVAEACDWLIDKLNLETDLKTKYY